MKGLGDATVYMDVMYTDSNGVRSVVTSASGNLIPRSSTDPYQEVCLNWDYGTFHYNQTKDGSGNTFNLFNVVEYRVMVTSGIVRIDQVIVYDELQTKPPYVCVRCPISGAPTTSTGKPASEVLSNFQEPHKQPGYVIPKNEPSTTL